MHAMQAAVLLVSFFLLFILAYLLSFEVVVDFSEAQVATVT